MSIDYKKQQVEDYFSYHPDRQDVEIIDGGIVVYNFPALFDSAAATNNKDMGNMHQQKYIPHLTYFSGHYEHLKKRDTVVRFNGKLFKVMNSRADQTSETFQGETWLV